MLYSPLSRSLFVQSDSSCTSIVGAVLCFSTSLILLLTSTLRARITCARWRKNMNRVLASLLFYFLKKRENFMFQNFLTWSCCRLLDLHQSSTLFQQKWLLYHLLNHPEMVSWIDIDLISMRRWILVYVISIIIAFMLIEQF